MYKRTYSKQPLRLVCRFTFLPLKASYTFKWCSERDTNCSYTTKQSTASRIYSFKLCVECVWVKAVFLKTERDVTPPRLVIVRYECMSVGWEARKPCYYISHYNLLWICFWIIFKGISYGLNRNLMLFSSMLKSLKGVLKSLMSIQVHSDHLKRCQNVFSYFKGLIQPKWSLFYETHTQKII